MSNEDDYEVGYGKPPKSARFKPGQSGNPKGRPKGARNFKSVLDEVLASKVRLNRDGKNVSVSTTEAALLRLREKALKGDPRALDRLLNLAQEATEAADADAAERELTAFEAKLLEDGRSLLLLTPDKDESDE